MENDGNDGNDGKVEESLPPLGVHVAERIGISEAIGNTPANDPIVEFNAIGLLNVDKETGEIKIVKYSLISKDSSSVKLGKGKKILIEMR